MRKECITILCLLCSILINAQEFIEHPIDEINGFIRYIKLHDFDSDENVDIVAAVNGSSQVMVWFGLGNGDFEAPVIVEAQSGTPGRDIELLDVNNDGNMDIITITTVFANGFDQEMLVYYINNGDRTFENFELVDPNVGSSISNFFSVFDVNNDNLDDIVIRRIFNTTSIVYYPNLGNGSFGTAVEIIADQSREVFALDFNNDNLIDIVTNPGGFPSIYINNGDGTFVFSTFLDNYTPSNLFLTVSLAGQVDNNTTSDILFSSTNFVDAAGIVWYSNDGNANFTVQENITNPTIINNTYSIAKVVDLNNDGDNDLIAGIFNSPGIGIPFWINDGNSNFTSSIIQSTSDDISNSLDIFDFNNDNKMDFVVGTTTGGKLTWFENNLTLSVDDNSLNSISITPNPSEGIYTITNTQNNQLYTIQVYNTLGQRVASIQNSDTIDLSAQPSGMYIAKIEDSSGTNTTSKKLIKL